MIMWFKSEHAFLSNFHPSPIEWGGITYPTVEHAYQAMKAPTDEDRARIAAALTPGAAKRLGRKMKLDSVSEWNASKDAVMAEMLQLKFAPGSDLTHQLLATGDQELLEGNTWNDTYWGVTPTGRGQNRLGRMLMELRAIRREELTKA